MNAENGVPVELGFVHFLTSAGNCEGNRKIEFGGSVFSDFGNEVSYHRMPSGQAIKSFLIICDTQPKVKRKYPVSLVDMVRRTRRKPHPSGWSSSLKSLKEI